MKIFITGGTGFIGKYVVKKLDNSENKLLVLSRSTQSLNPSKNISFVKGDLRGINQWKVKLKKFKPEIAIHLAWEGIPNYGVKNSLKNLEYGLSLTRVLAEIGCKKMLTSGSLWEYGKQKGAVSERINIYPFNAFTAAKNSQNWMGNEIAKEYNMVFIWTRLFYIYGPGQKETSLISYLIKCAKENKTPEIRNPDAKNDFVYVSDVVEAMISLLSKCNKSDVFNIGSGKLTSVKTISKMVSKICRAKTHQKIIRQEQMDALSAYYADITKISEETGWEPEVSIEDGLKMTINSIL